MTPERPQKQVRGASRAPDRPEPRVLVVTYGVGHVRMVLPVVRVLQARGIEVVFMALTGAGPEARSAGFVTVGYSDLVRDSDRDALRWGEQLLGESHNPALGIPREESIAYLGLSYADVVARLGRQGAETHYGLHGRHAFFQLGPMTRALEMWRPDLVLTTNSPKSERAMQIACHEAGIPVVMLDDTLGIRPKLFPSHVPSPCATRICVGSEVARLNMIAQGPSPGCLRVTGNPAFDPIAELDVPQLRDRMRRRWDWPASDPVLLCAPEPSAPIPELAVELSELLRALPRLRIILRRHPSVWHVSPGVLAALPTDRVRSAEEGSPHATLAGCDFVLGVSSTLMIEALLLNRPLVQAGPGLPCADWKEPYHEDVPLFRHCLAILACDRSQLHDAVRRKIQSLLRSDLSSATWDVFPIPGRAAAAVVDVVQELLAARGQLTG